MEIVAGQLTVIEHQRSGIPVRVTAIFRPQNPQFLSAHQSRAYVAAILETILLVSTPGQVMTLEYIRKMGRLRLMRMDDIELTSSQRLLDKPLCCDPLQIEETRWNIKFEPL